jgi:hypothetical protein
MKRDSVKQRVIDHINHGHKSSVYTLADFRGLGDYSGRKQAVSELIAEGKLRRVKRGLYESPYYSSFLEQEVRASPLEVAKKIARKKGWKIAPSGNTALNALGLSTQVPAEYHFASSGTNTEIELEGGLRLYFEHVPANEIVVVSSKSALVVEAIKALGKTGIDDIARKRIVRLLSDNDKDALARASKTSREWVSQEIGKILAIACTE